MKRIYQNPFLVDEDSLTALNVLMQEEKNSVDRTRHNIFEKVRKEIADLRIEVEMLKEENLSLLGKLP
ncbi:MAG: hypothetical protein RL411_931 [Bacteroidota bacterium]|jgi:hypothetical protein